MTLADFYQPFNIFNLVIIFLLVTQFEIIGFYIASKLKFSKLFRLGFWLIGLSFYIFIWFILHFFLPFNRALILLSLSIFSGASLPFYAENKAWESLLKELRYIFWPLTLFLLVARQVFYLLSSPPYLWDEMAYHFYSPAKLINESNWGFSHLGLYAMLPRWLDTGFILFFSAAGSHVAARTFHFLVFLTTVLITAKFLRKNISFLSSLVFTWLILFFDPIILTESTSGYIDVGEASFLLLSFLSVICFFKKQSAANFYSFVFFVSLALATKYSGISFIMGLVISFLILYLKINLKFIRINKNKIAKLILISSLVFIITGGYWYLKNIFYTNNPIYPFLFPCRAGIDCGRNQSFFSSWTLAFKPKNFLQIRNEVFNGRELFFVASTYFLFYFFVFIRAFKKNKKLIIIPFLLITSVVLEIIFTSKTSGFLKRYFYHWYFLKAFIFSLPLIFDFKIFKNFSKLWQIAVIMVYLSLGLIFIMPVRQVTFANFLIFKDSGNYSEGQRLYASGKMDIYGWTRGYFPNLYLAIYWCSQPKEMKKIVVFDPDFIWFTSAGLSRVFLVNCQMIDTELENYDVETAKKYIFDNDAYLISVGTCKEKRTSSYPEEIKNKLFSLNQNLICDEMEEVVPHLYRLK